MAVQVFPYGPRVAADPQGRCICCMLYMCQMAVLPAMDPDHLNDENHLSRGALVGNSYILNLGKLGIKEVNESIHSTQISNFKCGSIPLGPRFCVKTQMTDGLSQMLDDSCSRYPLTVYLYSPQIVWKSFL